MSDRMVGFRMERPGIDPFVGRGHEMAILRNALDAAVTGHGGLVIVAGEAGIGKSRLAEALSEEARSLDIRVAWGRCWEAGGAPAYWPWIAALRALFRATGQELSQKALGEQGSELARILPELRDAYGTPDGVDATVEESEAQRFALFDAVARTVRELAQVRPVLLVLDDLHAADEPTLLLLRFVCAELVDAPVLILATHREAELDPTDPRIAELAELGRQAGAVRLSPRGLTDDAIREYMEAALGREVTEGLADTVHRQTEGNPLFVSELVRLLADEQRVKRLSMETTVRLEIPEGVRAVIGRRLARLPASCRELLDRAAVMGVEFGVAALTGSRSIHGHDVLEALDQAARADVLIAPSRPGGTWRFRHALIREVVYSGLPAAERLRLHLATAETLESLHETDPDPPLAVIAHHYIEAIPIGDPAKAVAYVRRAARRSSELTAHEEAMRLYRAALAIQTERSELRVELLIELGDAATRAGDPAAAREAHLDAAVTAEQLGLIEYLARAAVGYGGRFVWVRAGTDRRLIPLLERALASLGDSDDRLRVRLLARLAGALRGDPTMERRSSISGEALAVARRIDDAVATVFALVSRYWAISGPDVVDELASLADELAIQTAITGDRERTCDALDVRRDHLSLTGAEHGLIRAQVDAYGRIAHELRQPAVLWYHEVISCILAINEGRLDAAWRMEEAAYHFGERTMDREAKASRAMARFSILREEGRVDAAVDEIRRTVESHREYRFFECMAAFIEASIGDRDLATSDLRRLVDEFLVLPHDMGWLYGMTMLAEAALRLGDVSTCLAIEGAMRPYAALFAIATNEVNGGPVARVLGLIAALDGRPDAAISLLEDAERRCARSGIRTFQARSMVERARALQARGGPGDRDLARAAATAGLRLARIHGLLATEEMAVTTLAELDGTSPVAGSQDGEAIFRRDGDSWEIGMGRTFRLRRSKGLTYLAELLATPGREHHVLDLVMAADGSGPSSRTDDHLRVRPASGAIPEGGLDDVARSAYQERLAELSEELEAAEAQLDGERAERARWEIDALTRELRAAYGLGGRQRPEHSAAERARQSVTKAIRDAIRHIGEEDPDLGAHLARAVRTGAFCAYDPEPSVLRAWRLS